MRFRIKYPNITILTLSIVVAVVLFNSGVLDNIFGSLGSFGYVGALIAGILLPITFTSPIATVALLELAQLYDPLTTAILALVGALIGDLGIYTFVKDGTLSEIEKIRTEYRVAHRTHDHYRRHLALVELFKTKPFHALAVFIGGLMILLPVFPDELGVGILASYRVNIKYFIPVSLVLNGIGIWIIVYAGSHLLGS